jgi:hypothetical protein
MHKGLLITIIGGAVILILTARYVFTPNSANLSSVPYRKSYAVALINNERHQGPGILADNQATLHSQL